MRTNLYSIYDTIAEVFNKPFTEFNDNSATRAFTTSMDNEVNKNDYALYRLGSYDDNNGTIEPLQEPQKIYSGMDISAQQTKVA